MIAVPLCRAASATTATTTVAVLDAEDDEAGAVTSPAKSVTRARVKQVPAG